MCIQNHQTKPWNIRNTWKYKQKSFVEKFVKNVENDKPIFAISKNLIMQRDQTSTLDVSVNEKLEFVRFNTILDYDENAIEITGTNMMILSIFGITSLMIIRKRK